jgi:hypothetical protein
MQKQSKSAKIEEWKHNPLLTEDQQYAWWIRKQDFLTSPTKADLSSISHESPAIQDAWPTPSPASMQFDDVHSNDVSQPRFYPEQTPKASAELQEVSSSEPTPPSHANLADNANQLSIDRFSMMGPMISEPADTTALALSQPTINTETTPLASDRWRKYF